jgi:hypothetical protein
MEFVRKIVFHQEENMQVRFSLCFIAEVAVEYPWTAI